VLSTGGVEFPLWLALDQVRAITLNDDEALINYAKSDV
jgi:threonyl-tRNA synthetase